MPNALAAIYRPDDDQGRPLTWFRLDSLANASGKAEQGDFSGLHQKVLQQCRRNPQQALDLYLFLADELVSFHPLDVPPGARRNLQRLLPVLLEEQLAQDIDQVAVHYTGERPVSEDAAGQNPVVNTAVWDREALENLLQALKAVPEQAGETCQLRIKACLPLSACPAAERLEDRPQPPAFWALIPRVPEQDRLPVQPAGAPEQLALQLQDHRWNLVTPEQSEISPWWGVGMLTLAAAGLYLLNQWLSVA